MRLEVIMIESITFGWEFFATAAGVILTTVLFFVKMYSDIKRLEEKIMDSKRSLSDEHRRHDETLFKELTTIVRKLEQHINREEIESALQKEARKDIKSIRDTVDKINCKVNRGD